MTRKTTPSSNASAIPVAEVLPLLEAAYLSLLQMPFGAARIRNQATFAKLRDKIAELRGQDARTVQDEFEDKAAELHP